MGISKLFENIRKAQGRHKVFAYLLHLILSLIMLGGFWILVQYGVDDDRYFWLGIMMVIIAGLAMLPTILPNK
jgi:hypothetical protein